MKPPANAIIPAIPPAQEQWGAAERVFAGVRHGAADSDILIRADFAGGRNARVTISADQAVTLIADLQEALGELSHRHRQNMKGSQIESR